MRFKAVVFDVGGTLIDYANPESLGPVLERNAEDIGLDAGILRNMMSYYLNKRKRGLENHYEAKLETALSAALATNHLFLSPEDEYKIIDKIYFHAFGAPAKLFSGAKELLEHLRSRGLKTGIISNTPFSGRLFEQDLQKFGILNLFDSRIWSADFGRRKPSPVIFEESLSRLGVRPEEAMYVGDTIGRDVEGAKNAGMQPILVNRRNIVSPIPDWTVKELEEIPALLK